MDDDEIEALVLAFLDARGGYVAGASERELFLMVKQAITAERERAARILETKAVLSRPGEGWILVDDTEPDRVRQTYAKAIREG